MLCWCYVGVGPSLSIAEPEGQQGLEISVFSWQGRGRSQAGTVNIESKQPTQHNTGQEGKLWPPPPHFKQRIIKGGNSNQIMDIEDYPGDQMDV